MLSTHPQRTPTVCAPSQRHNPPRRGWVLSNALWVLDVAPGHEMLEKVAKYDLTGVADRIRRPTLVCVVQEKRERCCYIT